jgi:membrane protease YdiL (CAAX protease family)
MKPWVPTVLVQSSGRLRSGWRLALFIFVLVAAVALLMLILSAVGLRPRTAGVGLAQPSRVLPALAGTTATLLLVSEAFLWVTDRRHLSTLGLAPRRAALPGALLGVLVGALPVALSLAIFALLGRVSVRPSESVAGMAAPVALAAVAATCLVSLFEELLWRGYALQLLIEGAGRWSAALVTALLWALAHVDNPGANVAGVVYLVLSGVLIAWVVIRTGSLWFAVGYHVAWNVAAAHLFGLTTSGLNLEASLFRTSLSGPVWLTGGAYGFEGSFITEALDILSLSTALLLSRRVPKIREALPYFGRRRAPAGALQSVEGSLQ